jgi:hypothetical protein
MTRTEIDSGEESRKPKELKPKSMDPDHGPVAGGKSVKIEFEKNLYGVASVKFGKADALEFELDPKDPKKLTAKSPPGEAGPVKIEIETDYHRWFVLTKPFTYG